MDIVIFDEHPVVLDSVNHYFSSVKGLRIAGMFSIKSEFINFIKTHPIQIIITEFLSDEEEGWRHICQLRQLCPLSIIIIYSALSTEINPDLVYQSGANGYMNKKNPVSDLHLLIKHILENEKIPFMEKPSLKYLTPKEISIVNLMIEGLTSGQIAQEMDCSTHTINNQKNHIIRKFMCKTSPELIAKLFRLGFLKL
jgi:DNA-binding NarL/FixJ family response regulator